MSLTFSSQELRDHAPPSVVCMLVGNKLDLAAGPSSQREVPAADGVVSGHILEVRGSQRLTMVEC